MELLSTILVLISAYTSINGDIIPNSDFIEKLNQQLLTNQNTAVDNIPNISPDLTPKDEECACLPLSVCNINNIEKQGEPCPTCGFVSMRINDGTCSNQLVLCCKDAVYPPNVMNHPIDDMSTCPCVPYFQCVNGTRCTDGCGIIDMRINDGSCSGENIRCCAGTNNATRPTTPHGGILNLTPAIPKLDDRLSTCPCVPRSLCFDGTRCTDGCELIDMRINDDSCPGQNVRCCKKNNNTMTLTNVSTSQKANFPNLTPTNNDMSNCPCVPYYRCDNGTLCTDGCGVINMRINDGSCSGQDVRCCKEENSGMMPVDVPTVSYPSSPNLTATDEMSNCPCIPSYNCYNGTPCTDGCDAIDMRINDKTCAAPNVLCCKRTNNVTMSVRPGPLPENPTRVNLLDPTIQANDECPCVFHYLCKNGTICTDGCETFEERMGKDGCPNQKVRCCKEVNNNVTPKPSAVPKFPVPNVPQRRGCGVRNPNGIGFRIQSANNVAKFGEFPWMVAILWEEEVESEFQGLPAQKVLRYQCGGSLIHPQVVLTATHCVISDEKSFQIRAGEYDIDMAWETYPHQDRVVVNVITHPEYYSGGLFNDIALLILDTPLDIAPNVDTVCLPPADDILKSTRCFTSGWGKEVFDKPGYQTILKKVLLPIVQRDRCQELLRIVRSQDDFELHQSFVCAGGEKGKDSCVGDGGSPLVCPFSENPKRYYQGGIVSWGIGCGTENVPGIYANVALFRNWIDEQMIKRGFDTSYYNY